MALIAGPLPVRFETFCSEETLALPANTEFFLRLAALRGTFINRTVLMLEVPVRRFDSGPGLQPKVPVFQ